MTMISSELKKIGSQTVQAEAATLTEARISALKGDASYDVTFRSGGRAYAVKGPAGLKVGQDVVVQAFPGRNKYVISQEGYQAGTTTITEASV